MSSLTHNSTLLTQCLERLDHWLDASDANWFDIPGKEGIGCYGTGYNAWGVQTNQKFLGAMATLGALGHHIGMSEERCNKATQRALAALRFSLDSHLTGEISCLDDTQWGRTWISGLGIERMMYALPLLRHHLNEKDLENLRRVLFSEADAVLHGSDRFGRKCGVVADVRGMSGLNVPESNLWNGAICWRVAAMYPEHPEADALKEMAASLLINSVSIASDENNDHIVDGKKISERYVGANFYDNFALDHHGYMNVGYMVICTSNAAMLHFDLKHENLKAPESLYHHQADLWQVIRKMLFNDGRLCRIGGDSRVRYTYCQEYLLPSLAFAAEVLGDEHAGTLAQNQLGWIREEQKHGEDPHFYLPRLSTLARNPYYFTRLEADRACCLAMLAQYLERDPGLFDKSHKDTEDYERSVAGVWTEPVHGDAIHRSPTRLASFAWKANGLAQGMCTSPHDGHMSEWLHNLGGMIRFSGESQPTAQGSRKLVEHHVEAIEGGFVTSGKLMDGAKVVVDEGWNQLDLVTTQLAVCALPDDHTLLGMHFSRNNATRIPIESAKSLHLNLPNDLFNQYLRKFEGEGEAFVLSGKKEAFQAHMSLDSRWVNVDDRMGAVGIYGAESLSLTRNPGRTGGKYESLHVEEINFQHVTGPRYYQPREIILDSGWAVLATSDKEETREFSGNTASIEFPEHEALRGMQVTGINGKRYAFIANFSDEKLCFEYSDEKIELEAGRASLRTLS